MKKLNTFGKAITKIFEVFHWIGAVGMAIAAIGIIFANSSPCVRYIKGCSILAHAYRWYCWQVRCGWRFEYYQQAG